MATRLTRNFQYVPTEHEMKVVEYILATTGHKKLRSRNRLIWRLMMDRGMRIKETVCIRLENIYWDKRGIEILGAYTKNKEGTLLYIPLDTWNLLISYCKEIHGEPHPTGPGWLFPGRDPERHLLSISFECYLIRRLEKLHLRRQHFIDKMGRMHGKITCHSCRRYFGEKLIEHVGMMFPNKLRKILRVKDINLLLDHYAIDATFDDQQDVLEGMMELHSGL